MGGVVHAQEPLFTHMSVDLRRLQAGMTQKLLYDTKIGTSIQEMSGERVPQRVRVRRDRGSVVQDPAHVTGREPVSPPVEEERFGRFGGMGARH